MDVRLRSSLVSFINGYPKNHKRGINDCATFLLGYLKQLHDVTVVVEDTWTTKDAVYSLEKLDVYHKKFNGLDFPNVDKNEATTGDIALIKTPEGRVTGGVFLDNRIFLVTEDRGLISLPPKFLNVISVKRPA